jgi:hypothetical protein
VRGTRNADSFKERLREVFQAAQEVRATLDEVATAGNVDPEETVAGAAQIRKKEWLECHARDFVLDHLLAALNWQKTPTLDATPYVQANLVIEQPPDVGGQPRRKLKPSDKEKRKRMDYLGYERDTDRPLLVLEAKRPELQLPGSRVPGALRDCESERDM